MSLTQFKDRWEELNELFNAAAALPSRAAAETFVRQTCGDDDELCAFLLELLDHADTVDDTLHGSIRQLAQDVTSVESLIGQRLGAYRIDRLLARGGMGAVYLASRADGEFDKKVAIKIVHKRLNRDELARHFRTERQVLANLSHPSIPALVDAGQFEDGRPYFICDFVDGIPIDDYCQKKALPLAERIALLTRVGEALQHAHNNLVLHLDIKPDNVLVQQDGTPSLLDFGIARLMGQREIGLEAFTPRYASPERLRGETPSVASDVYSLGLLLYCLLLNRSPVSASRFAPAATRLADQKRFADTMNQPGEMPGIDRDLRAIVRKATALDPADRYASIDWFLRDLKYYRLNLPVSARRRTASYRLGKYVRRRRVAIAVVGAGLALTAAFGLREADWHEEQAATRLQMEEAYLAAEHEAETARQVSAFLTRLFELSDPGVALGDSVTVREMLDESARRISVELTDRPLVAAHMMRVIGEVYTKLGLFEQAVALFRDAVALREAEGGGDDAEYGRLLCALGDAYMRLGDHDAAEAVLVESLAVRERSLGPRHPDVADSLTQLGRLRWLENRFEEAETTLQRAVAIGESIPGPETDGLAESLRFMALLYRALGRRGDAEQLLLRAIDIKEKAYGPDHDAVVNPLDNLANLYRELGRHDDALVLHERSLRILENILSPTHPRLALKLNNMALVYNALERYEESEPLLVRSLSMTEAVLGEDHYRVSTILNALGTASLGLGRLDEAQQHWLRSLSIRHAIFGADDPRVGATKFNLGDVYLRQGHLAAAELITLDAIAIWDRKLKDNHVFHTYGDWQLGNVYREQGRYAEAGPVFREAYETLVELRGHDDPDVIRLKNDYADYLRVTGRPEEADGLFHD